MADRWDRIGLLFEQALAQSPETRLPFIDQSPEPDDVKAEVRSLVAAHEAAGDFLQAPAAHSGNAAPGPADDEPLLEAGTVIGPYRITRLIGRGGMGVVYEGRDTRLNRAVAVKCLAPELSSEERQRQRLRQEARAAAALRHPGIAVVYALEELGHQLFIVSEYLEGETLRAEVARGPLPPSLALRTALDVAEALAAAHDRGIVHRDLKPENVIRTPDGRPKILDFGLAQFDEAADDLVSRTRLTQPGMIAGTPPYMAPEQLLGRETDFRTDHFAFGVLLYELCTGRHPFEGRSYPSIIARILAADPEAPAADRPLPPGVWEIVSRCLQKDPGARFATSRDLVAALAGALDAAGGASRPAGVAPAPADGAPGGSNLWWWRFHQLAATLAYGSMVWPAWHVRRSFDGLGLIFFFGVLAAVVVAGILRLHLWFSSRVYPEDLAEQRARAARWILAADIAFAVLLVAGGIALPDAAAGWGVLLTSFGVGAAVAFLVIEPATARAAFRRRV